METPEVLPCSDYVLVCFDLYLDVDSEMYEAEHDPTGDRLAALEDGLRHINNLRGYTTEKTLAMLKDAVYHHYEWLLHKHSGGWYTHIKEGEALRKLRNRLGFILGRSDFAIYDEGHAANGDLLCKFSWPLDKLPALLDYLASESQHSGVEDFEVPCPVQYFNTRGWVIYPGGYAGNPDERYDLAPLHHKDTQFVPAPPA